MTVFLEHCLACVSRPKLSQLISCALDVKTKLLNLRGPRDLLEETEPRRWRPVRAIPLSPPEHSTSYDRTRQVSHHSPASRQPESTHRRTRPLARQAERAN